jgi:PAS domain S-box-containing protein
VNNIDIRHVIRAMPGLVLLLSPHAGFTIVAASEAYSSLVPADEQLVGRPLFEVFPVNPADLEASGVGNLTASLRRVLATGKVDEVQGQRYDVRACATVGGAFEERYWHATNSPVLDAQGNVEYILHCAQEAVATANRDAVEILESITEGFFTLDRQWRFDYVNRSAYGILGRDPGTLYGKVLWEAYPGLEGTEFERGYRRTMEQREKSSFTAFYPLQERWYEVTTFPAPEGVSVYFRNVTEQKKLETEREELIVRGEHQQRIYRTALDSTPDLVYVFDLDHSFIYANQALLQMWGLTDYHGKKLLELGYEPWHAQMHDREIDEVIATRRPIRGEVPFTGTQGRRVYDYIFAPVLDASGDVVAVAGTTRDITERQASELAILQQANRLAELDRSKDEFLATLSHELRNPLAPLRNSLALLRMPQTSAEKVASVHAMMERQVNHLVRLVDDLLEVSRISRGTLSLQPERVDLCTVVRNALEASDALIRTAGHAVTVNLPAQALWVKGDPVRLAQILTNLLNNAANYTERGGTIEVHALRDAGHAAVTVRDSGVGMAPDTVEHMFEMFTRGDRASARTQGGLGIGLALARRLAQMHGGSLLAHSEGVGQGSEFTLRLPLDATLDEAIATPSATEAEISEIRVLVVDDNIDAGDSLAALLAVLGAQVQVARDGQQALKTLEGFAPAVVLLDIGMPVMNGYDVARAIHQRMPERRPLLVALTGWGQEEDRRRAREAGFDHHLVKPAEVDALQQLLASVGAPSVS